MTPSVLALCFTLAGTLSIFAFRALCKVAQRR